MPYDSLGTMPGDDSHKTVTMHQGRATFTRFMKYTKRRLPGPHVDFLLGLVYLVMSGRRSLPCPARCLIQPPTNPTPFHLALECNLNVRLLFAHRVEIRPAHASVEHGCVLIPPGGLYCSRRSCSSDASIAMSNLSVSRDGVAAHMLWPRLSLNSFATSRLLYAPPASF